VKTKVNRIAEDLAAKISTWEGVEAVLLGEAADIEIYDPYFTIDLDVYMHAPLPSAEDRRDRFGDVDSFETQLSGTVDRFLVEDLRVSVHLMETEWIQGLVHRLINSSWVFHETGTNMLYRIVNGKVLYSRGGWLAAVRASRAEIPDEFWTHVCLRSFGIVEHALADLGAAAFRRDNMFFLVSSARLLRGVSSFLFALNREFEPSGRTMNDRVRALSLLPDEFVARMDTFLRPEDGLDMEARREIAEHLVRSLIPLGRQELKERAEHLGRLASHARRTPGR
jgi:hypothetical protein